jgi:hypothetical protein
MVYLSGTTISVVFSEKELHMLIVRQRATHLPVGRKTRAAASQIL